MFRCHGHPRPDHRIRPHQRGGRQIISRGAASHPHVPCEKHGFCRLISHTARIESVGGFRKGADKPNALSDDTPTCLVLGDEHQGVSNDVLKHCTSSISIPMQGKTSSLNVGVAAGIVLFAYRS